LVMLVDAFVPVVLVRSMLSRAHSTALLISSSPSLSSSGG
jgi:hypothetical protein